MHLQLPLDLCWCRVDMQTHRPAALYLMHPISKKLPLLTCVVHSNMYFAEYYNIEFGCTSTCVLLQDASRHRHTCLFIRPQASLFSFSSQTAQRIGEAASEHQSHDGIMLATQAHGKK